MERRKGKNLKKQTKLTNDNRWHFHSLVDFCYLPCTCKIKFIWPRWEIDSTKNPMENFGTTWTFSVSVRPQSTFASMYLACV